MRKNCISYKTKLFTYLSLLVLVILIFISTLNYINLRNTLNKNIRESNLNTITQLKNATEMMLKDADHSLLRVASDPIVENFMFLYNRNDADIVDVINTLKKINNTIAYNKYFNSAYIYYLNEEKVVDILCARILDKNNMTSPGEDRNYLECNGEIIDNVMQLSEGKGNIKSLHIYNIDTKYKSNIITLVKPISSLYKKPKALLFITIDPEYFDDMLNSVKLNEKSNVFIIDGAGKAVSTKNKKYTAFIEQSNVKEIMQFKKEKEGSFIDTIDNEENMVSFVNSEKYGWKFVYTIPTDEIYKSLKFTKLYILTLSALCLILGIGVSFIFAGKLYVPINGLVNAMNVYNKNGSEKNDIAYIGQGIEMLISQNKNMEERLKDSMPVLKNSLLSSILQNDITVEECIWEKIGFYNACILPESLYAVCVMGFDEYEEFITCYSEKQMSMLQIYQTEIIKNVSGQFDGISSETVKMNDKELVLLISLHYPGDADVKSILMQYVYEVHKSISQNMKYTITIGVGSICNSIYEVYRSCREARSAYGYRIIRGNNEIISIDNIPMVQEWYYTYPFDIEKSIFRYLKERDVDKVYNSLNEYFEYSNNYSGVTADIRYAYIHLLDATLKCCVEMALNVSVVLEGRENLYKDLLNQGTASDMHHWFKALYSQIIEYINNKKADKNDEIVSKTLEYINNSFMSPDIGMEMLSEQLHYSVSYLGKLFKDTTQKTIKEYITEKRIEKAKELLETSSMKIKEVGEMVGYPNVQSFIKIFKKYHGETPGEYQDRHFKKVL